MQYKDLGNSGIRISAVSFGSMRWPSEQACHEIINRGLDLGLNYVDTSTGYCRGDSEKWTGRAVAARRDEVYFSSKCQFAKAPPADEVRKAIEGSLKATGLDYFDFYQIWGLGSIETLRAATAKGGLIEGVRKAQRDGLVRIGLGFTFHGPADAFRAAVDTGEFLCATVAYNLMNRKEEENIAYAAARGLGVVIMSPLAGGVLALAAGPQLDFLRRGGSGSIARASSEPQPNSASPPSGPSDGALRFLHANPGITAAIVGFRAVEEVDQAVASLDNADAREEGFRERLAAQMDAVKLVEGDFCTGCGYCKECPNDVNPTKFMQTMRDFALYAVPADRLADWIHSKYPHSDVVKELGQCTECGQCEEKCPQKLAIIEQIRHGREALAAGKGS